MRNRISLPANMLSARTIQPLKVSSFISSVFAVMAVLTLLLAGCTGLTTTNDMARAAPGFGENHVDSVSTDTPGTGEGAPESERPSQRQSEEELDFDRFEEPEDDEEEFEFEDNEQAGFGSGEDEREDFEHEEGHEGELEPDEGGLDENVPGPTGDTTVNMPQVCTQNGVPPAGCECATDPGFKTYTFQHAGEQRCMTSYVDPQATQAALPLIIRPNCYSSNGLDHPDVHMAQQYGFHYLDLTSPDGGWAFPLNNQVNDSNYQGQCDDSSTKDIGYLKGVFKVVDQMIADGLVDPNKVFVNGFSQNSVFAIFVGTCFPDRVAGVFQGASGIYSQDDGASALPKCEGACTASAFIEHGVECREIEPCDDCQYFPVFPERTGAPIKACIAMYDDDGAAHSTAVPAYRLLKSQGHHPTLMIFGSDPEIQLGGHDGPLNPMAWVASCLGLHESCSQRCSDTVLSCMDNFMREYRGPDGTPFDRGNPDHRGFATQHYNGCLIENPQVCSRGCSATRQMLTILETPACECDVNTVSCECQTSNVPGVCE